jgi:hypothetical protein
VRNCTRGISGCGGGRCFNSSFGIWALVVARSGSRRLRLKVVRSSGVSRETTMDSDRNDADPPRFAVAVSGVAGPVCATEHGATATFLDVMRQIKAAQGIRIRHQKLFLGTAEVYPRQALYDVASNGAPAVVEVLLVVGPSLCRKCGANVKTKSCAFCLRASYCSRRCQKRDWRRHRPECWLPVSTGTPLV